MSKKLQREMRVQKEAAAHTDRDVLGESYAIKNRFNHIWTYPSRIRMHKRIIELENEMNGKVILDYGCGRGNSSFKYLRKGAFVHGIDISPKYISEAEFDASEIGFPKEQYEFKVMDAHELTYSENKFDFVIGEGILHHLETDTALREIYRVLKPGGRVLLLEPLADNLLLKLFRVFTPNARTDDEKPFTKNDIRRINELEKWCSNSMYCGILEAPVSMFTSLVIPRHPDNKLIRFTDKIETWLLKKRILLSWNQYVLFDLTKCPE